MSPKLRLKSGAATSPGRTALENEDAHAVFVTRLHRGGLFGRRQTIQLAVVADGISGNRAGADASRLAVETFRQYFHSRTHAEKPVWELLNEAIMQANGEIYRESLNDANKRGMGATVVAAAIEEDVLYVGHVGDSRAYLMRRGKAHQLTVDHTQVQELVSAGRLSPEAAQNHPERFHLTRRLGRHDEIKADLSIVDVPTSKQANGRPQKVNFLRLERGDTILLCSDGLPLELSDESMQEIVSQTRPVQAAAQRLVEQANAVGGRDNITAVLLQWPNRRNIVGTFLTLALAVLVVAYYLATTGVILGPSTGAPPGATASSVTGETSPEATNPTEATARESLTPPTRTTTIPSRTPAGETTPMNTPTIITLANTPTVAVIAEPGTVPAEGSGAGLPPRATIAPTPLPPAIPTPTDAQPNIAVAQPVAVPTAAVPTGAQAVLLNPEDGSSLSGNQLFSWQADFSLAENQDFELIFWRPGEDPLTQGLGWAGFSKSTQTGVDLQADFIPAGEYRWGVRLVQESPYQPLLFLGAQRTITINKVSGSEDDRCKGPILRAGCEPTD